MEKLDLKLTLEEYRNFVRVSLERLIEEECFTVSIDNKNTEKNVFIKLTKPKWYTMLDENTQKIIFDNLQSHILMNLNHRVSDQLTLVVLC